MVVHTHMQLYHLDLYSVPISFKMASIQACSSQYLQTDVTASTRDQLSNEQALKSSVLAFKISC